MKKLIAVAATLLVAVVHAQNKPVADNNVVVTKHQIKIGQSVINYTATTGFMLMKDENDSLKAKVFYVAYTKDGEKDTAKRPLLFAYNGGPGSSSVWLHMGAIGPKKVILSDVGLT